MLNPVPGARSVLAVLPLLLATSGCIIHLGSWQPSDWVSDTQAFEVDRADLTRVTCNTANGSIRAERGAEGGVIRVHVQRRAGADGVDEAREALANIEITHKRVDGGLALGWRWRERKSSVWQASVSFRIEQPADLPLDVTTHNGEIACRGVTAGVVANSHNGDVSLEECGGPIEATSHNGDVRASGASTRVAAVSHNGDVDVRLTANGALSGEIRTHNGRVSVGLPDDASTRLVCTTDNGRIESTRDFASLSAGRRSLRGVLGKGEGQLVVHSHNGSIRVH